MTSAVASRYASALVDLVTKPGAKADPRAVLAEIDSFTRALHESRELKEVLLSPAVPPARKRAVVDRLGGMLGLSAIVSRFFYVIIDHRRAALIPQIREAYEELLDERLGVVRVDISAARELTAEQRDTLIRELSQLTGKQARARFSIDEELIGGVVARIGSTIYDGSVLGQLETLKQRLAAAGS